MSKADDVKTAWFETKPFSSSDPLFGVRERAWKSYEKSIFFHKKSEVFKYTEVFYNRQRLHATLGYYSPLKFERLSLNFLSFLLGQVQCSGCEFRGQEVEYATYLGCSRDVSPSI